MDQLKTINKLNCERGSGNSCALVIVQFRWVHCAIQVSQWRWRSIMKDLSTPVT